MPALNIKISRVDHEDPEELRKDMLIHTSKMHGIRKELLMMAKYFSGLY